MVQFPTKPCTLVELEPHHPHGQQNIPLGQCPPHLEWTQKRVICSTSRASGRCESGYRKVQRLLSWQDISLGSALIACLQSEQSSLFLFCVITTISPVFFVLDLQLITSKMLVFAFFDGGDVHSHNSCNAI